MVLRYHSKLPELVLPHSLVFHAPSNLMASNANPCAPLVRRPPPNTDHSADLWAPELHALYGRWFIYYAAGNPQLGNKSHRMYVLGGPPAEQDPCHGPWDFLGPVRGMPNTWAIDGTVFTLHNELFTVWSGWPLNNLNDSDLYQQLFIMKLADPVTGASQPVMISQPDHPWEKCHDQNGEHGINEGPQFLVSPNGSWAGIVYSCSGSWTNEYKMGVLHYRGGDPLDPRAWHKEHQPLIQTAPGGRGPWGPGHGSFLNLGGEVLSVYHATDNATDGWENRKARCQRVVFTEHGPSMGGCCGPITNDTNLFIQGGRVPESEQQPMQDTQGKSHGLRGMLHAAKEKIRDL